MDLAIRKYDTVPFRTMPPDVRAKKVESELYPFLQALLSLKNTDENADKIPAVLLMIEKAAYGLTFKEIKEAFVKYVAHELPGLTPKSNYLDGVLFSSVIQAYKQLRPTPKPKPLPEASNEEKENLIFMGICNAYEQYKQDKEVIPGYVWVYDHLSEAGIISDSKEVKLEAMKEAKKKLKWEAVREMDNVKRARMQEELENKNAPQTVNKAKRILLGEFFKGIKLEELKAKL